MTDAAVKIVVSLDFDALVEAIAGLDIHDKVRLWDIIDEQIAEYQEQQPEFRAAIDEAHAAYESGNYDTLEEYKARFASQFGFK